uniref:TLC domain-containing protein n=1 Tax=Panagrellus redivivus TaxID=6233 RepID=A0A7E4VES0_PANRE
MPKVRYFRVFSPPPLFETTRFTSLFVSLVALFFFRHHLFVWSVFAPKIVYDFFHTVPTTLIVLLHSVLPRLRFL